MKIFGIVEKNFNVAKEILLNRMNTAYQRLENSIEKKNADKNQLENLLAILKEKMILKVIIKRS